ncbi:MAG: flagellar basal-body rod protein FlgF [Burkholderiaceae bacterium]|jgi:flagellar basal-body rod protein FlgF
MDRLIYTALSSARSLVERQAVVANNLANVNTNGFRADISTFTAAPVQGAGLPTRVAVTDTTPGVDLSQGPTYGTGRALDVAVQGSGWLTVQTPDGNEAYTRDGNLSVAADGTLVSQNGLPVMSDSGPIAIPPDTTITIGSDGTVSAIPVQAPLSAPTPLGQLKLVNPPAQSLTKGDDGMMRQKDGTSADADPTVQVVSGALEGSNVSPATAMVSMISLARQFDMQMKMLESAQENSQHAAELLTTS